MILLTDGNDENGATMTGTEVLQKKWFSLCKKNKIYGIFDDLKGNIEGSLPDYFKNNGSSKLFRIDGANFNINIFQLSNTADEVLLRKDSLIRIPFAGKLPAEIDIKPKEDEHYRYELVSQHSKNDKYLKIKVSAVHGGKLPDSWSPTLHFLYKWGEQKENTKNFPDKDTIVVTIVDEKTPKLELSDADMDFKKGAIIKRNISYYKKWHGIGNDYSDTVSISLSYLYSKDVINDPSVKRGSIRIEGLPEYVCILDSVNNDITNNDILLPGSQNGRLNLKLTLKPENTLLKGNEVVSAKIRFIGVNDYNTIKWNGKRIEKTDGDYVVNAVTLNVSENINPIEKVLRWILILLFLTLFLLWASIMFVRSLLNKFSNNSPALQFKTDPQCTEQSLNIDPNTLHNYKDNYQSSCITSIIIKHSTERQDFTSTSWGITNFWNLRQAFSGDTLVIYVNSHGFFNEIEMKPLKDSISVRVDNQSKRIKLNKLDKYEDLQCFVKDSDGKNVKLTAKIYRNTIKQ